MTEFWGGLECSVVRIGDEWRDQLRETGHYERLDDLEAIAELGLKVLRFPILMEHVAPFGTEVRFWHDHDKAMARLQSLGIDPIVGLIHHGSGPHYTDLLDPAFPVYVAAHARAVAHRYPWVARWTPVNEPLTTARFSGLYGHWYPHQTDERAFLRMHANQCLAVVLAMQEVRAVNPDAQLVQTEDACFNFSTPAARALADKYNQRRWLTYDLLSGRVDASHSWWSLYLMAGVPQSTMERLLEADLGEFLLGLNYYPTSDRWLDCDSRGQPIDEPAVRVRACGPFPGIEGRLRETALRYPGHPIAITECHLGSDPDEQIRWVSETVESCCRLANDGINVEAITLWSLFGSLDWNTLLMQKNGHYEPGIFSLKQGNMQKTPFYHLMKDLIAGNTPSACDALGWWRKEERFFLLDVAESGAGRRRA
jgi:dTDP-4-dehydrorhamnose reductase